jgi:release factor glutamine methyltransferase
LIVGAGLPRIEARALLEHVSGRSRSWLIAHGNETAEAEVTVRFAALVQRRRAGEPLAYLIGFREFHGLSLRVNASVLIPRADTETLVDLAIERAPADGRLLDLGTGSGAIVIAVGKALPALELVATDLSDAALQVAAANGEALLSSDRPGGPPRWLGGSWWQALPPDEPPFDLIVANPPYIRSGDPHLVQGDLPHEPAAALASGPDGLEAITEIARGAPPRLVADGWLLLEHGHDQGAEVRALLAESGWREIATHRDAEARERVTVARAP